MSTILIGIAGGTGSGKTTLTRHLKEHFGPEVTVIGHDNDAGVKSIGNF